MNNDWEYNSLRRGSRAYPTPAPSPQVDAAGIPLPPSAPRHHLSPLPNVFSTPRAHLHPLLSYANCPSIAYDIRKRPSTASTRHGRLEWAHESATSPPSAWMTITCHLLPRPFVVLPSAQFYDFVTLHDILQAVHCEIVEALRLGAATEGRNVSSLGAWNWADRRPEETRPAADLSSLLAGHSVGLNGLSGRYIWKGLSEEKAPGDWILHIE